MITFFGDTSFLVASIDLTDPWHTRVMSYGKVTAPLVTSEFVLVEVLNFLSNRRLRMVALHAVESLANDPGVLVIEANHELYLSALDLYGRRQDKDWSLTDCSSIVLMEQMAIGQILTFDHHFVQAGFAAPLIKQRRGLPQLPDVRPQLHAVEVEVARHFVGQPARQAEVRRPRADAEHAPASGQ